MHFRPKKYIFLLLLLISFSANAQILNIEKSRIDKDSSNYFTGTGSVGFNLFNRNTGKPNGDNFTGLAATTDVVYFSGKHSFFSINSYNYVSLRRETFQHAAYTHERANFFRSRKFSYEIFTQYQYDLARRLEHRFLAGAGVRTALLRSEKVNLYIGNSLMYEFEQWLMPNTKDDFVSTRLPKLSNYLSTRAKFNEQVELNAIVYYQTGYDNKLGDFRHRVSGETNITSRISGKVRIKTSFNALLDNRPVVPLTHFLYNLTTGLQANF
ncbi:MAG: DUF481 domain-containing protein [Chitinophagaceae bacterium]|nr:MAG: DUF481 domain-containing protein [Chitinophagaceae bacterium]